MFNTKYGFYIFLFGLRRLLYLKIKKKENACGFLPKDLTPVDFLAESKKDVKMLREYVGETFLIYFSQICQKFIEN